MLVKGTCSASMDKDLQAIIQAAKNAAQSWQSTAPDSAFREADGGYYWNDDDHYGEIFISQSIVDKYNLGENVVDPTEEWFEDEEEIAEDWKDKLSGFSHYIITTCSLGFTATRDDTEIPNSNTPRGKIDSREFKAWWNNFPVKLLEELETEVFVMH